MKRENDVKKIVKKNHKVMIGALAAFVAVVFAVSFGLNLAEDREITIASLEELEKIGRDDNYPLDADYILENDIDGEGAAIDAIGTEEEPFAGHFDGQGYTIKNMTVTVAEVRETRIRETEVVRGGDEEAADDPEAEVAEPENAKPDENAEPIDAEADENAEPAEGEAEDGADTSAEETETIQSMMVSVDGYPLFEYTVDEIGQVENLNLEDLTAVLSDDIQEMTMTIDRESGTGTSAEDEAAEEEPGDAKAASGADGTSEADNAKSAENTDENTGTGTGEPAVVELHNWEEFKNIGNTDYNPAYTMDADYVLVEPIASDGASFTPIGTEENPFTGTFDGQGLKIDVTKNPEIDIDSAYNGLFGVVRNSEKTAAEDEAKAQAAAAKAAEAGTANAAAQADVKKMTEDADD